MYLRACAGVADKAKSSAGCAVPCTGWLHPHRKAARGLWWAIVFSLHFCSYASTTLILLVADDCIRPSNSLCSVLVQESQPNRCMWSLRPNPDHAELQIIYVRMTAVAIRDQPPC